MILGLNHVLLLLVALQAKHFVADGPLQTRAMVEAKGIFGKPLGLLHALLHGLGTSIVFAGFGFPLVTAGAAGLCDLVVHYAVDFSKEQIVRRAGWTTQQAKFWWALSADQALHQMTYVALAWWFVTPA